MKTKSNLQNKFFTLLIKYNSQCVSELFQYSVIPTNEYTHLSNRNGSTYIFNRWEEGISYLQRHMVWKLKWKRKKRSFFKINGVG